MPTLPSAALTRRRILQITAAAGVPSTLFSGALFALYSSAADAQTPDLHGWPAITPAMIDAAAAIAAVKVTDEQKTMMLDGLLDNRNAALRVRELRMTNATAPATVTVIPPAVDPKVNPKLQLSTFAPDTSIRVGGSHERDGIASEELTFASVRELGFLLRRGTVTSVGLTRMYLARLKRLDATLHFVITLTEERALKQAAERDAELKAGKDRGPLHGIPWGAKDLFAVKGYPTTWGAAGFEDQHFDEDAEVVQRLDAAGAVLIAKLSMGALAQGDLWGSAEKGARTRNPWNPKQGSSGSSAGSASAVGAGCVAFALGTETLGSISSPATRCGVVGLRPSYGRVPRTGAMALSWSMDKIGPITRSVEDAALVLDAIHGPDGHDLSCQPGAFGVEFTADVKGLRVGYLKSAFELPVWKAAEAGTKSEEEMERRASFERDLYDAKMVAAALDGVRGLGVTLTPCELPGFHFGALHAILSAEEAAAFDELTLSGRDALLAGQKPYDWPNSFRTSRFIPAVDYIQAQRARTLAIEAMRKFFADFDVIVTPSGGTQLTATNLCGQPAVIVPIGLRGDDAPPYAPTDSNPWPGYGGPGTPASITFLGPVFGEAGPLALAAAFERALGFRPTHTPKLG